MYIRNLKFKTKILNTHYWESVRTNSKGRIIAQSSRKWWYRDKRLLLPSSPMMKLPYRRWEHEFSQLIGCEPRKNCMNVTQIIYETYIIFFCQMKSNLDFIQYNNTRYSKKSNSILFCLPFTNNSKTK